MLEDGDLSVVSDTKTIGLKSCEGEIFTVSFRVATMSNTIKNMIEDLNLEDGIIEEVPLKNISSHTLKKIIEYCEYHVDDDPDDQDWEFSTPTTVSDWDSKLIGTDQEEIFALILAANFLDIPSLLDVGKEPEEIRKIFNIENDFTPEEEEEMRAEYAWLKDD
ncbi:uncharacterized protein LOC135121938 isoform X2 [Zophobas morio]|uniref:uncharacterized protein LOC135121938 isoform X2 n=1 Tax=Zophobas morio TaxID=2755281 RepID=UPI003082F54D